MYVSIYTVPQQEDFTLRSSSEQGVSSQHEAPPPSQQPLQTHTPPLLQMSQTPLQSHPTLLPMNQTQSSCSLHLAAAISSAPQNQTQQPQSQQPSEFGPHASTAHLPPFSSTSQPQQAATLQVRPRPALRFECLVLWCEISLVHSLLLKLDSKLNSQELSFRRVNLASNRASKL